MKVVVCVTVGDLTLRNSEVEAVDVFQALGQHTRCRVEFTRDRAQELTLELLLSAAIRVTLQEDEGDELEIFAGRVSNGSQAHLLHFGSRFILDAISPSIRHELRNAAYFPQATLASIATQLGAKLVGPVRRDPGPFNYVQWGETEFEFLERLADQHGCFLVTTGPAVEIRSGFQDKGWELKWGETLLEATARARPSNNGTTGASYDEKLKSTHWHAGVRQPAASLGGASKLTAAINALSKSFAGGGDPLLDEQLARTPTHADFKAHLRDESERALGTAVLIEGVSGKPGLLAGDQVELVEGEDFSLPTQGTFGIVQIIHAFRDQHYLNRFVATPWRGFTNMQAPARRLMPGPVRAEVIDDVDPMKLGRVRVQYPWLTGEEMTSWARVVVPHAGSGRGFLFLPEIGDEILVAFEQGDPENPYVIGALWNGKALPPGPEAANTAKRIVTRSGNTIQLLDDTDSETVEIFTRAGKCIVQMTNKGGNPVITLQSEGDIALEAKHQIRMKCQTLVQDIAQDSLRHVGGDESAEVGNNATIKAGMQLAFEGMNTVLKAGMNLDVVAGGTQNLVATLIQLQPPGYAPKTISTKPASVNHADLGTRTPPDAAAPQRTADGITPRAG